MSTLQNSTNHVIVEPPVLAPLAGGCALLTITDKGIFYIDLFHLVSGCYLEEVNKDFDTGEGICKFPDEIRSNAFTKTS